GLGDAIVGLYAVHALHKKLQTDINYYTRFPEWIRWWKSGLNLKSIHMSDKIDTINLWQNYDGELLSSKCRKLWYCQKIDQDLMPEIVDFDDKSQFLSNIKTPIRNDKYVVILPFATTAPRTWPKGNWHYLLDLIRQELNLEVILLDGPGDGVRHSDFNC